MLTRVTKVVLAIALLVVTGACGPTSGEDVGSSDDGLTVVANGVDYSWARPSPSGLYSGGYRFAARYLSYDTTGKNLSKTEANDLWAAGVDIVANWENNAPDPLSGYNRGVSDAKSANSQATACGIPAGRPIYFSVDFDVTSSQYAAVEAYFDGVASVIGLARTGAYGGYYLIQDLFNKGKIKWGWQTYAWSYGNWDSRAQLRQVLNDITAAGDVNCCDHDQAVATDYGQWHADLPPTGSLDAATCTAITGTAQDSNAPSTNISVDLYFDAKAGTAGVESMRITAGNTNHGFSVPPPVGMLDGKAHSVYAYGIDTAGGPSTLLTNSPKSFTCPNATPPLTSVTGVRRHIDSPGMTAWKFSKLTDVAPEPDSVINALPKSTDWTEKPQVVQADDGTPEVWLIDGQVRRHIVSTTSLSAWHLTTSDVVKTPAATVYAHAQGPDLPATPFLMISETAAVPDGGTPDIWVLDVALTPPGSSDGGAHDGGTDGGTGDPGVGGCTMHASSPTSGGTWVFGVALPLLILVRRRRAHQR